jgi:hypothetical protein
MLHTFSAGGKAKKTRQHRSQSRAQESNPRNRLSQPMSPGGSVRQIRLSYRILASLKGLQIRIFVACPSKDNVYWPSMKPGRAGNIFDTTHGRRVQERWYFILIPPGTEFESTLADMVIAAGLSRTEAELLTYNFVEVLSIILRVLRLSVVDLDPDPYLHRSASFWYRIRISIK